MPGLAACERSADCDLRGLPDARHGRGRYGKLDAGALSQQAKSLQSVSAEGALLAHDASLGRSTRVYSGECGASCSV